MKRGVGAPKTRTDLTAAASKDTAEISVRHGKSFDENIDILSDEILLAVKWGRPSVLLAVHKSKFGQDKAERALEARLAKEGLGIKRIVINDRTSDVSTMLSQTQAGSGPVYFISNLDWGGGTDGRQAYRALNLHRELFVENEIKAVFWLTTNEAASLPRLAPDFWAFRHRVVEFISQRAPKHVQLPAGVLAWDPERSPDPFENAEDSIRAREELLDKLPESLEALSARIELYNGIGYLFWSLGDLEHAEQKLRAGLELTKGYELAALKASLLNGLGIVLYEKGDPQAGLERFRDGLRFSPSSRPLLINISAAHCMQGRNHEGLLAGKKAVRANPADAGTWRQLGYIYNAAGKPDEAIGCLQKAVELAPRAAANHEALAVLYSLVERADDARAQLAQARALSGDERATYCGILRESMFGDIEKAQDLLHEAVTTGQLTEHQIRRDPNLCLLLDRSVLDAVSSQQE